MIKLQLSDFQYIDRPKNILGKALRFTLSIRITRDEGNPLEFSWEGNMAFYSADGLKWSPPISRFSGIKTVQLHWINPEVYNLVLGVLNSKPHLLEPMKTALELLLKKREENRIPQELGEIEL